MPKKVFFLLFSTLVASFFVTHVVAQQKDTTQQKDTIITATVNKNDTFFLAKKKGWLGKLGKSISISPPGQVPVKIANPYLKFTGKTIRNIQLVSLGFERSIYDTNTIHENFGIRIANDLHKNTRFGVLRKNLFFKENDRIFPYFLADNEKHLRELPYIQDARIVVTAVPGSRDSVDVLVLTKDVFSIGGSLDIGNIQQGSGVFKEENLAGTGNRFLLTGLYDQTRNPQFGYGGEYDERNIKGSFVDWTTGFKTFNSAFSGGGNEETEFYSMFERPLVSAFFPWTGAASISVNKTDNDYTHQAIYDSLYRYSYYNLNAWFGYNFGANRLLYKNLETRLRKFVAIRTFDQHFLNAPSSIPPLNFYQYEDMFGILGAIDIFQQDIYRTNFIYGFGKNEDVPEGFSSSLVGGWTVKQGRKRPYYGFEFDGSNFTKKQSYYDYTFRIGGYIYNGNWEDADILLNADHFTKLKKISNTWFHRDFFTAGITKQIQPVLNQPLFLQSSLGLPYFNNGTIAADFRTTIKAQSVFYDLNPILGFRFAPFLFTDLSMLTPANSSLSKSDLYSALGGGIRTRNENLIFGTIELKGYYFPRTMPGMSSWRIELNTNIQFTFSSTYIRQPDFIIDN